MIDHPGVLVEPGGGGASDASAVGRCRSAPSDSDNTGAAERRQSPRFVLERPVIGMAVSPDGRPDQAGFMTGNTVDLSRGGVGVEFDNLERQSTRELLVGVKDADGQFQFAGVIVCNKGKLSRDRVRVGCQFGGKGQELLKADLLAPTFVPASMSFASHFPEDILKAWSEVGILKPALVDRVQMCPKCHGLPTFRPGCRQCGSADVGNDQLMHHFACAHVGLVGDFEMPAGLLCPKCRTNHLIVGSDFEYVTGPYRCRQCQWSDTELEQVAQCLRCGFRFPGHQAHLHDFRGYRANRLEPLALLPPS